MSQIDWKAEIARVAHWKQVAAELDHDGVLQWHLPRLAATAADLALAERALGTTLSSQYRQFLEFADGWPSFVLSIDLFGTRDFIEHRESEVRQRPDVMAHLKSTGTAPGLVTPIGASNADVDVFLLLSDSSAELAGGVIWLAGAEVERFDCFHAFFAAMVNYNAQIASRMDGSGSSRS